jgi:type VI secretion system FHA domain protein
LLIHLNDTNAPAHREATTHLFGPAGGRIGRSAECELVLRDPEAYVSNLHASIARRGERWIEIDHSTNGIVLNDAREPLPAGSQIVLHDGDRLKIGPYRLVIAITPDPNPEAARKARGSAQR